MQWTRRRARIRVILTQASCSSHDDVVCPVFFASLYRGLVVCLLTPPGRSPPLKKWCCFVGEGSRRAAPSGRCRGFHALALRPSDYQQRHILWIFTCRSPALFSVRCCGTRPKGCTSRPLQGGTQNTSGKATSRS